MARISTDGQISNLPRPLRGETRYSIGFGLSIAIRANGQRVFYFQYTILRDKDGNAVYNATNGLRKTITIGHWGKEEPLINIAEAKEKCNYLREQVEKGVDPQAVKKAIKRRNHVAGGFTFADAQEVLIDKKIKAGNKKKTIEQLMANFKNYFDKPLGDVPMYLAKAEDLQAVLDSCEFPILCRKLRSQLSSFYKIAMSLDYIYSNLTVALNVPKAKSKSQASVADYAEQVRLIQAFETITLPVVKHYFYLLAYTFVRPSELGGARWEEFDLENYTWTIPAGRMKKGREFSLPITPQMAERLTALHALTGETPYLFPLHKGPNKGIAPQNRGRPANWLVKLGFQGVHTAHGFRAMATGIFDKRMVPSNITEISLSHKLKGETMTAYHREKFFEQRFLLMTEWCEYIDALARGASEYEAMGLINPAQPVIVDSAKTIGDRLMQQYREKQARKA